MDDSFSCLSCGRPVVIPGRNRFTLSRENPESCAGCGAPHVFEASIHLHPDWVYDRLRELDRLKSRQDDDGRADAGHHRG